MSTLNALDATLDVPNACPITAVSIVIAESSNSGPAYITAGNTIQLHANLSPAGASVPSGEQVIWKVESQPNGSPTIPVPDPDSQSLDMTVEPSFTFPGTYEISVTVCCRQAFFTIDAYDLKLKSVTYSGDGFNKVIRDSDALADASVQEYKPPHYEAADAVNSSISKPVSFVRHRQMQVAADFRLKGDGVPPYVLVRGAGWDASGAFQCRYPESIASADEDTVFASPMGVIYVRTSSPRLLPGFIAKLEVFFRYQCKLPDDGDVWNDIAGNSDNVVYVTLSQPNPSKLCETLLEIGCTSAAGDTQEKPAFFHIWSIATTSTSETGGNGIPRKE